MGMYTEFHFNIELRKDVPPIVVETLKFMANDGTKPADEIPHELFACSRWSTMLASDSYYFSADTHSTLRFDDIAGQWFLCVRCNLKNYDHEIQKFCDWIAPFVNDMEGTLIGFFRYEESDRPTLVFAPARLEEV